MSINSTKTELKNEFIRVICKNSKGKEVYKNLHAVAVRKEARNFPAKSSSGTMPRKKSNLSVVILGIDGVSRLNSIRQMPRTRAVLEQLNAVDMKGYTKVADNTFPNLIPAMSGLTEAELWVRCAHALIHGRN